MTTTEKQAFKNNSAHLLFPPQMSSKKGFCEIKE